MKLNDKQQEAVLHTEGPLLILAGAGSGKTRVLTNRAAYLINDLGINPYNIMMITFTNKAAGEMRERIEKMLDFGAQEMWISTFHSSCVRILRRYADRIGYKNSFVIYDTDDSKQVIKEVCKRLDIDTKQYKEKYFMGVISHCKDELIDENKYYEKANIHREERMAADVYMEYQKTLKKNNAMDFDDLIVKTVELFNQDSEVLEYYQRRFKYVMVDEYQDTNTAQFRLIRLLAGGSDNLCVVGDDDQSIYKFRGANISNILFFEEHYRDAAVIRLEQNYRSTSNILNAANGVIAHNYGRKEKTLWTDREPGEKVLFRQFDTGFEEAEFVASEIMRRVREGAKYNDCAVLYRTNAQSRMFEEHFIKNNIPYHIVGGVNFYARKEIKDILCYLKAVDNGDDDLAVTRIINVPKRGIGTASVAKVSDYALNTGMSFFDAAAAAHDIPGLGKAADKVARFATLILKFRSIQENMSISELIEYIIDEIKYEEMLKDEDEESADDRIENISELISKAKTYEDETEVPTLSGFLEEVALVADIDSVDDNEEYVCLMTLHSAKGLEFHHVYLAGMEDGLFPSYMSINADNPDEEIEEERRLCYVGITRAMDTLTMTAAKMRLIRGNTEFHKVSRFMSEVPEEYLTYKITAAPGKTYEKKEFNRKPSVAKEILLAKVETQPVRNFDSPNTSVPLDYGVGDRVRHIKFGEGTVTSVVAGGRDFEVTVDFDGCGVKKMLAGFAKLKKV